MLIAEVAFPVPLHRGFHYLVPSGMRLAPGMRVRAPFGPRRMVGTVLSVFDGEPARVLKTLESSLDAEPFLSQELMDCAIWMSRHYSAPIGECLKSVLPPYVKLVKARKNQDEPSPKPVEARAAFVLTPGQEGALASLSGKIQSRKHAVALLYGVPASGKTEVYLRLIRQVVAQGGQAMFLLPEISLTRPFFDEFSAELKAPVVLWHSQLGQKERREAYFGLREGRVKVVVGARSACLLPFKDLRLVVLDEEQDESFKQEGQSPLYHARDVALHRAAAANAVVVLGSATPAIETWQSMRQGQTELVSMPDRVSSVAKPTIGILALPDWGRCLSEELVGKIKDRLARHEQSILLVNRRGFSTLVMCFKCGWVDRCPSCGVAKIQHQLPDGTFILRCHHCDRKGPLPLKCPECKNPSLRIAGTGTQKVVSELKARLPGVRVLRMDRDTVSKENKEEMRIYDRFKDRQADVLVGTKLVAKSFHFPEVTLVGVIDADTMIHMPDFRASERTMQLLAQVAGRSGRAQKAGEVLIQTLHPDHYAITSAAAGDYGEFADKELSFRQELRYPPYSILVRLIWMGAVEENVAQAAEESTAELRGKLAAEGHEFLGPTPAIPPLVSGKYRFHLLMKVYDPAGLEAACAAARSLALPSTVKLKINVDPYDLF